MNDGDDFGSLEKPGRLRADRLRVRKMLFGLADTEGAVCVSDRYISGGQTPKKQVACPADAFQPGRHRMGSLRVWQMLFGRTGSGRAAYVSGRCFSGGQTPKKQVTCPECGADRNAGLNGVRGWRGGPEFLPAGVFLRGGGRRRAEIEFF